VLIRVKQIGRNDPCHCGSGRKYKLCCLGKDEDAQPPLQPNYDAPLLVNGDSCSECEGLVDSIGNNQQAITAADNHIRIGSVCFLSRTASLGDLGKPEYSAKGFTWYLRLPPRYGGKDILYFKDIKTAMYSWSIIELLEHEVWIEQKATRKSVNEMRRFLSFQFKWPLLREL
jgi:hypothetical protein